METAGTMETAGVGGSEGSIGSMRFVALAVLMLALGGATDAAAAPVLVLGPDGVRLHEDRFLPAASDTPATAVRAPRPAAVAAAAPTVSAELDRMLGAGAITAQEHDARLQSFRDALAAYRSLSGIRKGELGGVIANLEGMAARGSLTVSRLRPFFATLDANRRWWTEGPLLACAQRVGFAGSELVWQYYAGQGIQLQMLANFGKANALATDERYHDRLGLLLRELAPLASKRGAGVAWEYQFRFGIGKPPWASAMAQATALQAFAHGSQLLADPALMDVARAGLPLFRTAPPVGVKLPTPRGTHYLIYSFDPHLHVLNAFIQTLVGLYDYAKLSGDAAATTLFDAGDREARHEVPRADTGHWSLYAPGRPSDLNYHRVLRDFLRSLCQRTGTAVYCSTATRFTRYLRHPPPAQQRPTIGCKPLPAATLPIASRAREPAYRP